MFHLDVRIAASASTTANPSLSPIKKQDQEKLVHVGRHTDTNRQTDSQPDRQTDTETHRETERERERMCEMGDAPGESV